MSRQRPFRLVLVGGVLASSLLPFSSVVHAADDRSDLPIATDSPPPQEQPQAQAQAQAQPQPQPPPSAPIATDPVPDSDRSDAIIAFATIGVAPILSRAGSPASRTDGGGLFGFRAFAVGVEHTLAFHIDIEGRLGGGNDGFLTRDRGTLLFGGNVRVGQLGAFTMRAGAEARYVRSNVVEYGRILAPAVELGVYRFGTRESKTVQIDLSAIGGLAAYTSLHANNGGVAYDRSLAPGAGGSLVVGARYIVGRVSYLRAINAQWAGDLDAALCFGQYLAACIEADHVMVDPTSGTFTTWRALLSLGIGIAWAE